ncbi:MAG: ATP F0F1 synthase subunit B [Pseudomonadota bacterium]
MFALISPRILGAAALSFIAAPAFAAGKTFWSLANTDLIVAAGFIVFIGILVYFKVPKLLGDALDARAEGIQKDLDEARALREEAQSVLAGFERKQKEAAEQAEQIVEAAKSEAMRAAEQAKEDLQVTIARRLQAAEDQIQSAEDAAVKEVRDRAATVAVRAAGQVIAAQMAAKDANQLIDDAIATVGAKLH